MRGSLSPPKIEILERNNGELGCESMLDHYLPTHPNPRGFLIEPGALWFGGVTK